ncbi:MAG: hypothetical protein GX358_04880 [candidate division WS1 bacterium]|jgi:hypothetical protein|nr:hypothetical protein [candidate division WS1 bacterium]
MTLGFAPYSMTSNRQQLARISGRLMKQETWLQLHSLAYAFPLASPRHCASSFQFWIGVEALYDANCGITYIRSRTGDDPTGKSQRVATAGSKLLPDSIRLITTHSLRIYETQNWIATKSKRAYHNTIDQCLLTGWYNQMVTAESAAHNMAHENAITLNYYEYDDPCARGGCFRETWPAGSA